MQEDTGALPHELIQNLYIDEDSPTKLRWLFTQGGARQDSIAGSKRRYYSKRVVGWKRKQYPCDEVYRAVKKRDEDARLKAFK